MAIVLSRSQLHSNRPPLPDVPAVYFVAPTLQNVRRMAQDLENNLYESFHLNFVEPLSRALLEELAAGVAKDGTGELVSKVGSPSIPPLPSLQACLIADQVGVRPIPFLHLSFTPTLLSGTSTSPTDTSERSPASRSFNHTHILSHPQFPSYDRTGNRN